MSNKRKKSPHRMALNLLLGSTVSVVLVYLAARGVSLSNVYAALGNANAFYVAGAVGGMVVMQVLRSFRWGLLLRPLVRMNQLTLFSVTSVGFLAIIALPLRLGEIVRPYVMAKRAAISVSSSLSVAFAERIFDAVVVLLFVALVPILLPTLPPWFSDYSLLFIVLVATVVLLLFLTAVGEKRVPALMASVLGKHGKHLAKLNDLWRSFAAGLGFIKDWRLTLSVFVVSLLVWLAEVLVLYFMLLALGIVLPVAAYLLLTAVLLVAIAIPAAPGFIGSWHYACVLGLSFFGVAGDVAFAFGVLYHFITVALLVLLGVIFLPGNYSSLKEALSGGKDGQRDV